MGFKRSPRRKFAQDLLVYGAAVNVGASLSPSAAQPSEAGRPDCNPISVKPYLMDVLGAALPGDLLLRLDAVESAMREDSDVIFTCTLIRHTSSLKDGEN